MKIVIAFLFLFLTRDAGADSVYTFKCPETSLKGSIPYSVIGKYNSIFETCTGRIVYDGALKELKSVQIEIDTASIRSNCLWCDRIVKSRQVLDAKKFPKIVFNSSRFEKGNDGRLVLGSLDLHGVTQDLESTFIIEEQQDGTLDLKGTWVIKRKDHKIIWNKLLDHGGVLVGENITVRWQVKAKKSKEGIHAAGKKNLGAWRDGLHRV